MIKKNLFGACIILLFVPTMLSAQSQLKSEANGPINFNTSGNDLQLQDNGNPVTLKFKNSTSDPGTVFKLNPNGNFIFHQKNNNSTLFKTNGQENMRITPGGHIGIGLTNPSSMLSVNGVIESTNGGVMFPDGTVQTTAFSATSIFGSQQNPFHELFVNDYIKLGTTSLYLGSTTLGSPGIGDFIFTTTNPLRINGSNTTNFGNVQNTLINPSDGLVGIGTAFPTSKLDLRFDSGDNAEAGLRVTAGVTISNPRLFEVRTEDFLSAPPTFKTHFVVNNDGQVGISTPNPNLAMLQVRHNIQENPGTTNMTIQTVGNPNNADIAFRSNTNTSDLLFYDSSILPAENNPDHLTALLRFSNDANGPTMTYQDRTTTPIETRFHIAGNGNVGIGVTNPQAKLVVDGLICAKEVRVSLAGAPCWPDYVFEKDYQLTPLNEVEKYINENKHLEDVPSADELTKTGIELGEMDAILLKKIEELTLYVIDLEKRLNEKNDK
jgi:hypothetical protein